MTLRISNSLSRARVKIRKKEFDRCGRFFQIAIW